MGRAEVFVELTALAISKLLSLLVGDEGIAVSSSLNRLGEED